MEHHHQVEEQAVAVHKEVILLHTGVAVQVDAQIVLLHVWAHVLLHVQEHALAVVLLAVRGTAMVHVVLHVVAHALEVAKEDVLATAPQHVHEVVLLDVQDIADKHGTDKRTNEIVAGRYSKKHHVYCNERLPVSVQILLPRWQKLKGAYVMGDSPKSYRLYFRT